MRDSIVSKILAGVLTTATLATSVGAGYKVFAERGSAPTAVPTVAESSPTPTSSPTVLGSETKVSEAAEVTATPTPTASASPTPTPSSSPSVSPLPSFSPMPSFSPSKFDDSSDDSVEIEDNHVHVGGNTSVTTSGSSTSEAGDN